jgi:hypothetical protein
LLRKPDCRLESPTGAFMALPPLSLSIAGGFLVLFCHQTGSLLPPKENISLR